ncbi:MFS transporter [Rhodococcus koreensis]
MTQTTPEGDVVSATTHPSDQRLSPQLRRTAAAGLVGTLIEYFDFALYGLVAVYFAPLFFPAVGSATSLLAALAVFGAGFFARPLGGVIFGWVGDRHGRRPALVGTLVLMGLCSGTVGLLPTYESIGVWAPILLVLLRLGQGLSAGSEMLGSITFVLESAPPKKRIMLASLTPLGGALGLVLATTMVWILNLTAGREWMADTGWRLLFLLGFPLTAVAFWIRSRINDSPEFQAVAEKGRVVKAPLGEMFSRHWRALLVAGGVAIAANGTAGLAGWFSTYLVGTRELPGTTVFAAMAVSTLIGAVSVPFSGYLTSRYGQVRMVSCILAGYVLGGVPLLWLLGTTTSFGPLLVALIGFNTLSVATMPPAFTLIAQLFPAEVRYTGSNFGQNIGTVLGAGIAPFAAAQLQIATGSALGPMLWILGVATFGIGALLALSQLRARKLVAARQQ